MSKPLRHHLDRDPGFDQQSAVGVADVVQTDLSDTGAGDDPLERLGDGLGVDRVAVDIGEDPVF